MPNLIYKDEKGVHVNKEVFAESLAELPPPDFDGLPLEKYFVPQLILPYLATRGCYWGRCTFCDHFQGYVEGFRTKQVDHIVEEISFLKGAFADKLLVNLPGDDNQRYAVHVGVRDASYKVSGSWA